MGDKSHIQWTMATWNFLIGCTKKSLGCMGCYAIRVAWRLMHNPNPKIAKKFEGTVARDSKGELNWTGRINFDEETLALPLRWTRPRRIFVNSLSDFFHPNVETRWILAALGVMMATRQHTYQILTKHPDRAARIFRDIDGVATQRELTPRELIEEAGLEYVEACHLQAHDSDDWPLLNVEILTSVEDQATADERIPWLLKVPAVIHGISAEPLLGPIDLTRWLEPTGFQCLDPDCVHRQRSFLSGAEQEEYELTEDWINGNGETEQGDPICLDCGLVGTWTGYDKGLDWVIVGGESGPGARSMHLEWARSIVAQCKEAHVPVFVKQLGSHPVLWRDDDPEVPPYAYRLEDRKGGDITEFPTDLQVRELPTL